MRLPRPEAATTTSSPTSTRPETIVPAKPRKFWLGRQTHCTGQAERAFGREALELDRLEVLEQERAVVPGRTCARARDVVAGARGDRYGDDRLDGKLGGEGFEVGDDPAEGRLVETDEVHLVDGEHDAADAEQRHDHGMPARLRQQALGGVDQQDGEVGGGGAGRHVARILDVAGRVGDDEAAVRRGEEAVGDVDGDALLALRLQPVDEQREVDVLAVRAVLLGIALQLGDLVLHQEVGIVEQAPDQGGFAVVDAAAGEDAQRVGGSGGAHRLQREGFLVHQK